MRENKHFKIFDEDLTRRKRETYNLEEHMKIT